jgi:hypothetical protein
MENLLIFNQLWDYLSMEDADIRTKEEKRGDGHCCLCAVTYLPVIQNVTHAKRAWDVLSTTPHATSLGAKKNLLGGQLTELIKKSEDIREKSEDIAASWKSPEAS